MSTVNNVLDTQIELFGVKLDNPIIPASGTYGFGYEFSEYYDINCLGSISLKGTTKEARYGNPLPRIAECPNGLINAIGLQNPGVDKVIEVELKKLDEVYKKPVIANVGGHSFEEYTTTVAKFNDVDKVFAVELNISCPNVQGGGMAFGTNPDTVEELVREIKKVSTKPIIVKLSPNVTDIKLLAKAAERGGADGLSLINTLVGMRIDLKTARPIISVKRGGYSGPGVFPVAVNMVYAVKEVTDLPIIGMGGISSAEDVIEMMYAGATAVMVGSYNLVNPYGCKEIIDDLPVVMEKLGINKLSDITGRSHNV
ncbi:MAG: dihydroorotate dehydrogenase [Clostridia bacterium]|nr:dihydroorotate dehydrogenase [Clostridia bacterium]